MRHSEFLTNETQSSKWNRVRFNYELLKQVLKAKEHAESDYCSKPNPNLKISSTAYPI